MHTIANHETLAKYNQMQMREMEKHKWILSEKAGHDVGAAAFMDWITKYAKAFRESYLNSDRN